VIDGYEAVRCGLIDATGGVSDALSALRKMIKKSKGPAVRPATRKRKTG
jgi:hypothetical protein